MAWQIELSATAAVELGKLDPLHRKRLLKFLHERLGPLENPRSIGQALRGSKLREFWKYRVGDYRLIAKIEDAGIDFGAAHRASSRSLSITGVIHQVARTPEQKQESEERSSSEG